MNRIKTGLLFIAMLKRDLFDCSREFGVDFYHFIEFFHQRLNVLHGTKRNEFNKSPYLGVRTKIGN